MTYKIVPAEPFEQEYDKIIRYLVEDLGSPDAARSLLNSMEEVRQSLADNPLLHAVSRKRIPESLELRECLVRNYVVVYRVANDVVFLEHIFHQRQDFENLL